MSGINTLTISENKKYLVRNGDPFFWFGDTAWLLFLRMSEEEVDIYLRNRKEKGVNVIQSVLIHSILPNRQSSLPPAARDTTQKSYWDFVDACLDKMAALGLYCGLLPIWGENIKNGSMDMKGMERYADFLGKRFKERDNIIWILGGDVRGDAGADIFRREAEILKHYNPERLISFHPFGRTSSSMWFRDEPWLDINMFQSGHRRYDQQQLGEWDDNAAKEEYFGEDNWRYVLRDHSYTPVRPVLDGEPSYEGIPQGLHNPRNPYWEEWDARRYAYWSVFAGAAGHTYGNNAIQQAWNNIDEKPSFGAKELWSDAIHHPGIAQIGHLKQLMESVDYTHGSPRDDLLVFGQKERYHRIAVFAGKDFIFCYDYMGDEFMLRLDGYADRKLDCSWMDPRDGSMSYFATLSGVEKQLFSPVARKEKANDWVLVIRAVS
ncbi:MAG: glycoside hydrolase family 140 protein [Parasporobacterium sp.]|nr:glycoside hydrolase family 140 protein [Parasporobacterium sp.]